MLHSKLRIISNLFWEKVREFQVEKEYVPLWEKTREPKQDSLVSSIQKNK